ncbi:LytR/AlgR family response regulator transcription factor [Hymenobacter terrenus]|uniref:LytR/AlgR family response regulator transcription factor n=1 Tax=Hymenobacter terrenus TaxID=1629124 RepID=UPI0006190823|nr:LytTR family DNA-binding domain-containing protein [Hymenobacter terrenus]
MRIVVVEDEALIANRIVRFTRELLGGRVSSLVVHATLESATAHVLDHPIDLLILDLNLNGRDGFELLRQAVAGAFHTLIVSANTHRAIEAFEYGVLDFVPKPFDATRLQKAFDRFERAEQSGSHPLKYLAVRRRNTLKLVDVADVLFIQGANIYSELYLRDGSVELHDKPLHRLLDILPTSFLRVHKSYLVSIPAVQHVVSHGSSKYELVLYNGTMLPVSRERYKELKSAVGLG